MASRVIYSLEDRGGAPSWLAAIHERTSTPVVATLVCTAVALALALFFPIETLAMITSLIILLVFAASCAALVRLERREPEAPFDIPVWMPWAALVVCLALIAGRFVVGGGGH
jgi:amino acid transporter